MDKEDIIAELDKLKLKIMIDGGVPSELDKYKEWIDKLHHRRKFPLNLNPWDCEIVNNEKYATFSLLKSCVTDLYGSKHAGEYEYLRDRPETRYLIAEIINMVLFYQDELNKK